MSKKRILIVSISLLGILIAALGTVGFVLTTDTSAQVDEALSNPPAAPAVQSETEINAQYEALFSQVKTKQSSYDSYSAEGNGCSHDQAVDWSMED